MKPTRVSDLMSREVTTLERNEKLSIADRIMRLGRIRHMPVVEGGAVVGIVSQRDLFRGSLASALGYGTVGQTRVMNIVLVKEVMSKHVETIAPDASLADAARLMNAQKIGCLPVVENGELVGILTESDFVAHFAESD